MAKFYYETIKFPFNLQPYLQINCLKILIKSSLASLCTMKF